MTALRKLLFIVVLLLLTAASLGGGTLLAWRAVLYAAESRARLDIDLSSGLVSRTTVAGRPARPSRAQGASGAAAPAPPAAPQAPSPSARPTAVQTPPAAGTVPRPPAAPDVPPDGVEIRRILRPAVHFGRDYHLAAGDTVREVVVISGSADIEGTVDRDMVVVAGTTLLAPTAVIRGNLTVVGGSLRAESGADVRRDLVVVGGTLDAPPDFAPGGQHVVLGDAFMGQRIDALVPWVTQGLMWGRPFVFGLGWIWWLVAILFLVYLIITLIFTGPVRRTAETLTSRPLGAFLAGLLVLLLFGPVVFILAVSVVGIIVIPFLLCALAMMWVVGKVAVFRWIGASVVAIEEPDSKPQAVRSFAIGFVIVTFLYLVPVLGLITWATVGVWSLGAAFLTVIAALRRENPNGGRRRSANAPPAPEPQGASPMSAPAYPVPPVASPAPYSGPASYAAAVSGDQPVPSPTPPTGEGGWTPGAQAEPTWAPPPSGAYPPPPGPGYAGVGGAGAARSYGPPPADDLLSMPHAPFLHRAAAFALDVVLVLFTVGFLAPRSMQGGPEQFFALLLIYHVAFWTWKASTVGGLICNLRVIRSDGMPLRLADSVLRGLASIFSLVVAGLGALWILRDPERQAWHDRIAGTYVVQVPRSYPIR